ncbi:MAG: hypothetical protein ACRENX_03455 [Candidatus Dormibacteria bacterium]
MTGLEERFLLREISSGRSAEAWGFPVQLAGDAELCQLIRGYLNDPIAELGPSLDPETGERGTRVLTLEPGDPGWLQGCLRRSAQELKLRLSEPPLSGR